jgi:transposase
VPGTGRALVGADHPGVDPGRPAVNGVFWRTRCGLPWRDLPYGHWKTVYNRHRRRLGDGTWVGILDELRRDADVYEGPDCGSSGSGRAHSASVRS